MKPSSLPFTGFLIIMVAFVYQAWMLVVADTPLNLATWMLWVIIDISLLISIIMSGNRRPWSMIGFVFGSCAITAIALTKLVLGSGEWNWGNPESFTSVCVAVALVIWKFAKNFTEDKVGDSVGIVSITIAMYIAMVPTFINLYKDPIGQDPLFWGVCALGCMLDFVGKEKSLATSFQPACGLLANGLATILATQQFL